METLNAIILGFVEGITEFLPISSTGHMILAGHWLGWETETAKTFEVFIQLGAILAVVLFFPHRFLGLLNLKAKEGFAGWRGLGLLAVTTAPALVLGAAAHGFIKAHLFSPATVAIGLAVGAVWILVVEKFLRGPAQSGLDRVTWRQALAVGCFQCLAMWPGMSRSACTILGGMLVRLDRRTATEYSFFAAVPTMIAACSFDLLKSLPFLRAADLPLFAIGFVVSFISAWLAVKWFIHFVGGHTLNPFAWYRLALAAVVWWLIR